MQERKTLYSRCRDDKSLLSYGDTRSPLNFRNTRRLLISLEILLLILIPSNARALLDRHAWVKGRGCASYPSESMHVLRSLRETSFIGVIATCSRPYSLDDLICSYIELVYHSPGCTFRLDWNLLHHPLYREDRLSAMFGRSFPVDGLFMSAGTRFDRKAVRGFPGESSFAVSLAGGYTGAGPLDIGLEGFQSVNGCRESRALLMKVSLHLESFSIVLNRTLFGIRDGDSGIGIEMYVCRCLSLVSGYRFGMNEISGGLLYSRGLLLVGFSWNHHPALGRTLSLSVGRLWSR